MVRRMRLSFSQQIRQQQVQKLAPRMIQSMEILQLSVMQLQERIEQEMTENPTIELQQEAHEDESPAETDEYDIEQELVVDQDSDNADDFQRLDDMHLEVPDHFDEQPRISADRIQQIADHHHDALANIVEKPESLQDHLESQLHDLDLDSATLDMAKRILSMLQAEDGGYLKTPVRDLLPRDATVEEVALAEHGLEVVQSLDPSGIGARDLSECLRIQVIQGTQPNGRLDGLSNTDKNDLLLLIDEHIDDLTHNRLPVVQKKTGLSINRIDELVALIGELDPMPGARFVDHHNQAVTADLVLHESEDGEYSVTVEDSWVPTIRISRYYRERLSDPTATKEEKEYIRRKVNAAQWLVDAIQQRRSTLKSVAEAIVDVQQEFLKHGPERIVPLKMQQIADVVGVHVTTVSRAVDDKWMQTPRGLYPLKRFFVGGTVGEDGEDVAWDIIRIKLQELIDQENKAKPHSDDELVRRLKEAGMTVARRTITKYRKKMGIPSSRQRKDWSLVEKKRKS